MTASEFRAALRALGIRQNWLAGRLGVSPVTVSRWVRDDDLPVPQYAVFALALLRQLAAKAELDRATTRAAEVECLCTIAIAAHRHACEEHGSLSREALSWAAAERLSVSMLQPIATTGIAPDEAVSKDDRPE